MSVKVSRKLSGSLEGALAGGGDPASSPLYVFGPFLHLIVVAGVAQVTFGATIWLAVFTVFMVAAMYRQVMRWITDGSGGSGLCEEEFGSWAVKINAGITVIEYTLTFLVSMTALVTFIADRFPVLNDTFFGFQHRVFLAICLSFLTCWIVNRGPRVSVRVFGPATAAVLFLLWILILATIHKTGFHLPDFNLRAFSLSGPESGLGETIPPSYLHFTLAGYARILALVTGIEVFANLVAAYSGSREERSQKAFGSMLIVMGTTAMSMLVLGPMILGHTNALDAHVSVFTQAMDYLLPPWASYAGTLVGVVVLLSACAAVTQGIQNLALGLRFRHYIPASLGERNNYDVAGLPVWIMAGAVSLCYLLFGTRESTYLALYAAGVFVLLSMTGWAATKRLLRELKAEFLPVKFYGLTGKVIAALLTSAATVVIFIERFFDGAWSYALLVPVLYLYFGHSRRRLGPPADVHDWFGRVMTGQGYVPQIWYDKIKRKEARIDRIVIPLNGTAAAEQILPIARTLARSQDAHISLLTVNEDKKLDETPLSEYLNAVKRSLRDDGIQTGFRILSGEIAATIDRHAMSVKADVIAATTGVSTGVKMLASGSIVCEVIRKTLVPVLLVRRSDHWRNRYSAFKNLLVALDGSEAAEHVLPYIRTIAQAFNSKVTLLFVAEENEDEEYRNKIKPYLHDVAEVLGKESINATTLFLAADPARTILNVCREHDIDLLMMASHGRGGTERPNVHLGSVTEKVIKETECPVFVVPLTRSDQ